MSKTKKAEVLCKERECSRTIDVQGISIIATYGCNLACRHCFFERQQNADYLNPSLLARQLAPLAGAFRWIHFTGGEPLLSEGSFFELLRAVSQHHTGNIGVATNGYWARDAGEARRIIERMLDGGVDGVSLSVDVFHQESVPLQRVENAARVLSDLHIAEHCWLVVSLLAEETEEAASLNSRSMEMARKVSGVSDIPIAETHVRPIGRGSYAYSPGVDSPGVGSPGAPPLPAGPCRDLACCLGETGPFEPRMLWLDPQGTVLICYGIAVGSIHETPLEELLANYDAGKNPILSTLAKEGPIGLYRLANRKGRIPEGGPFHDECDLCFQSRRLLADLYPETLRPANAYPARNRVT